MTNQNIKLLQNLITYIYIYISLGKTLALKVKCNYNIFILRYLVLSIAFFLLLRCKSKIKSTTRRKMTVTLEIRRRKWVFLSTWPLLRGLHLYFCFQIDVWWENKDVIFLMVMEEKQNKKSSWEVRLGLMGYSDLRTY